MPPGVEKINFKQLNDWRIYTLHYFKMSPNVYFLENKFYNKLSENMRIKIVLDNMNKNCCKDGHDNLVIPTFISNFDYMFKDKELRFCGDKKLKLLIISSLTLEFVRSKDSIIEKKVASKIYFIDSGKINVYYKDMPHKLLHLEEGSYFGDISLLFQVENNFRYCSFHEPNGDRYARIYSVDENIWK